MSPPETKTQGLIPNLGAEEGPHWASLHRLPAVSTTVDLWRHLFRENHTLVGVETSPDPWPESLGPRPAEAALPWLEDSDVQCWWADPMAERLAKQERLTWSGPVPSKVLETHDKAFAIQASRELDLAPPELRDLGKIFDSETLRVPQNWLTQVERELGRWPEWTEGQFTLKPRMGSSGRGRIGGTLSSLDRSRLIAAAPGFAERGGAILEPWLRRCNDFSVQIHIGPSGSSRLPVVTLMGSLELWVTRAGVYRGHLGEVDSRGRVFSGGPYEEQAREAAALMAGHAGAAGYTGPCGIDGMTFLGPARAGSERPRLLRPIVEFNARFTMGTIVVGLIRRALDLLKAKSDLGPGQRRAFLFALDPPQGWPNWETFQSEIPGPTHLFHLSGPASLTQPALLFAENLENLRRALSSA